MSSAAQPSAAQRERSPTLSMSFSSSEISEARSVTPPSHEYVRITRTMTGSRKAKVTDNAATSSRPKNTPAKRKAPATDNPAEPAAKKRRNGAEAVPGAAKRKPAAKKAAVAKVPPATKGRAAKPAAKAPAPAPTSAPKKRKVEEEEKEGAGDPEQPAKRARVVDSQAPPPAVLRKPGRPRASKPSAAARREASAPAGLGEVPCTNSDLHAVAAVAADKKKPAPRSGKKKGGRWEGMSVEEALAVSFADDNVADFPRVRPLRNANAYESVMDKLPSLKEEKEGARFAANGDEKALDRLAGAREEMLWAHIKCDMDLMKDLVSCIL